MYIKIKEFNKELGVLTNYVRLSGNEEFIDKLENTINKFSKILFTDYYIVVYDKISDMKMNHIINESVNNETSITCIVNYYPIDKSVIDDSTVDNFIESFKGRKYFNSND